MATFKALPLLLLALIAFSMLATVALANNPYGPGSLTINQCSPQCTRRCSNTQYRKPCLFFCNKCCRKCLCVPPGFYGNKQVCPCYNNWKTQQGGPKCP
ncbi:gibberellin-regulated protein 6-like [Chenopodium quinoa]|uniref:gibberellin-regulated protein 6-like n=1 Tax=Chenopodium quinoa TaxID=63459 RepID=UPI000B77822D|nr:gibberellin-regulated protein 6-like [Chenopodium quinoa]